MESSASSLRARLLADRTEEIKAMENELADCKKLLHSYRIEIEGLRKRKKELTGKLAQLKRPRPATSKELMQTPGGTCDDIMTKIACFCGCEEAWTWHKLGLGDFIADPSPLIESRLGSKPVGEDYETWKNEFRVLMERLDEAARKAGEGNKFFSWAEIIIGYLKHSGALKNFGMERHRQDGLNMLRKYKKRLDVSYALVVYNLNEDLKAVDRPGYKPAMAALRRIERICKSNRLRPMFSSPCSKKEMLLDVRRLRALCELKFEGDRRKDREYPPELAKYSGVKEYVENELLDICAECPSAYMDLVFLYFSDRGKRKWYGKRRDGLDDDPLDGLLRSCRLVAGNYLYLWQTGMGKFGELGGNLEEKEVDMLRVLLDDKHRNELIELAATAIESGAIPDFVKSPLRVDYHGHSFPLGNPADFEPDAEGYNRFFRAYRTLKRNIADGIIPTATTANEMYDSLAPSIGLLSARDRDELDDSLKMVEQIDQHSMGYWVPLVDALDLCVRRTRERCMVVAEDMVERMLEDKVGSGYYDATHLFRVMIDAYDSKHGIASAANRE